MLHDWDIRLANYIESVKDRKFNWSDFDCLRFANAAVEAQTGQGFADDWIGDCICNKSAYKHYTRLLTQYGHKTVAEAIDSRLTRLNRLMPMRGNIVGRKDPGGSVVGLALGVAVSDLIAFVGHNGLEFLPPQDGDIYWSVL